MKWVPHQNSWVASHIGGTQDPYWQRIFRQVPGVFFWDRIPPYGFLFSVRGCWACQGGLPSGAFAGEPRRGSRVARVCRQRDLGRRDLMRPSSRGLPPPGMPVAQQPFVFRESRQKHVSMLLLRVHRQPTRSLDSGDRTAALPGCHRPVPTPRPADTATPSMTGLPALACNIYETEKRNPYFLPTNSGEEPSKRASVCTRIRSNPR
jgi:hypothetical protein